MRGEFIGVWSEMVREIWTPLIDHPFGENEDALPGDIFCELYRELSKALKRPTDLAADNLLLMDAIALREVFDDAAQLARLDAGLAKDAFDKSGTEEANSVEQRKSCIDTALSALLGHPATLLLNTKLQEHSRDDTKVAAAWNRAVEKTINDEHASRKAFIKIVKAELAGEQAVVGFLEAIHYALKDFEKQGDDRLTNRYFNLLAAFTEKFSLRYDLRRPCTLCPTLPGVFASLISDLRTIVSQDAHLDGLMKDFEESLRDLRIDSSERRIKTSIQKQVNLLEAIGRTYPGIKRKTLGAISKQLKNWPHDEVMLALQSMYTFTCDYPGIRHGGTPANARRTVDMRDMVAVSILLAGFTPYLAHGINADIVYRRT